MDEQPGLSDRYRRSSPWPVFVAFGLALFEVGIVLADVLFPLAVGGLLMFVGSIVGILRESGYVSNPWQTLAGVAVVVLVVGGVIWTQTTGTIATRGIAIAAAGVIALAAGIGGLVWQPEHA